MQTVIKMLKMALGLEMGLWFIKLLFLVHFSCNILVFLELLSVLFMWRPDVWILMSLTLESSVFAIASVTETPSPVWRLLISSFLDFPTQDRGMLYHLQALGTLPVKLLSEIISSFTLNFSWKYELCLGAFWYAVLKEYNQTLELKSFTWSYWSEHGACFANHHTWDAQEYCWFMSLCWLVMAWF